MKITRSLLSLLFFSISFFGFSEQEITTKVNEAIVFTQGAQLKRHKKVSLQKGENIIRFTGLELDINANSIQVYQKNENQNFTVIYTTYNHKSKEVDGYNRIVKAYNDSLALIEGKIAIRNGEIETLKKEKELIFGHNKIGSKEEESFVKRLEELADFYRNRLNEINRKIHNLETENKRLSKLIADLKRRFSKHEKSINMGVIEAKIYAERAVQANLELDYMVQDVNWTPFYEIKSAGFQKPLKTVCKATINQNTGVKWDDVKITLSTKKPEVLTDVPIVHPWVLYFQGKQRDYSYSNQILNTPAISSSAISNAAIPLSTPTEIPQNGSTTAAYLEQFKHATHKMINKEYTNNIKYDINGESGIAVMVLEDFEMEAEYVYYSVPKYDPNVYLIAQIEKWQQYDLIPAFGNIFLGGSYIGKLFIDPSKAERELQLMLGKEKGITVRRKKINQDEDRKIKITGGIETTEIGIELIVINNKGKDVDIIIKDQVPVSKTEEILVDVKDISRAKHNKKNGTLTWDYKIKSGAVKKHTIIYEVSKPKDKYIGNF